MISSLLIAGLLIRVAREGQCAEVLALPHGGRQPALIRLVGDNASVPTARARSTGSHPEVFLLRDKHQPGSNPPTSIGRHRRRSLIQRIFGRSGGSNPSSPDQPNPRPKKAEARQLRIEALKKRRQHRLR